jgi:hypothetical protein
MITRIVASLLVLTAASVAWAGGGPANVLVLYNADDADAVDVAEYYGDARSLPPGHLCGIEGIDPTERTIPFADYETGIHEPLRECLAALPQPEEIDYLVVVRGLPYRVDLPDGEYYTSLTAMLQIHDAEATSDATPLAGIGQYQDSYYQASIPNPVYVSGLCQSGDLTIDNPYGGWYTSACGIVRASTHPSSFRRADAGIAGGYDFAGNLFVATRLDGFDHDDAIDLVDRAVTADGSFPTAEILCMEGGDQARAARDPECEFATRMLEEAGLPGAFLTPFDSALSDHEVAAYFTGTANLTAGIADNTYVPGAIACNLTSFGAAPTNFFCNDVGDVCPASESQTSIARFVRAGATGAHGTVAEPLNNVFPNAGTLLHYTFGYNLGESFLFNLRFIYWQNIFVGDPLATPYAERPTVELPDGNEVPQGEALVIEADHPDGIAEIRLYLDGERVATEDGDLLEWVVDAEVGAEWEVLAVAVAANAEVERPGWPVESHTPRPDVQGWTVVTVTVGEPLPPDDTDDDDTDDDDGDDDADDAAAEDGAGGGSDSCGCRAVGARAPTGLFQLLLGAIR